MMDSLHILLVEDVKNDAELLTYRLQKLGAEMITGESTRQPSSLPHLMSGRGIW